MTSISDTNVVNAPGGLVELGFAIAPASTTVTATSIGSAHQLGSVTFVSDGSPVLVEFSAGVVSPPTANSSLVFVALEVDGSTTNRIYWISVRNSASAGNYLDQSAYAQERLVLSAGVHTIRTLAWCSGGTNGVVHSGGNYSPAITRVSKIIQASQLIVQTPNAPLVTSLPSNAIDGQEVRYLANNTNGIIWNFRYRAGSSSSYKWEFIGGQRLGQEGVGGNTWGTWLSTNSLTTVALSGGPSVTIPLAGDYEVVGQANAYNAAGDSLIGFTLATAGGTGWSFLDAMHYGFTSYQGITITGQKTITGLSANSIVSQYYAVSNVSAPGYFYNRNLWVKPIRVSA